MLDEGGIDALRAMPTRGGRPARLNESQLQALGRTLLQSPTAHGFGTERWILKRVGALIERLYGVKFGQTQIWRILGGLGFSVQKPERRAIERDEDAVATWKSKTWPGSKKSPARRPTDRLHRRVGPLRAAYPGAHLGVQGADTHHPVPLQLDPHLGDRRLDPHELLVPAA